MNAKKRQQIRLVLRNLAESHAANVDPETPISNAAWHQWIGQHPAVREWLDSIQSSEGMHAALRFALWVLTGQGDLDLMNTDDLQANDLAESTPLVTRRTLFGGE